MASTPPQEWHRPDGRVLEYEVVALPDGGRMLTYFDLTRLKRAEEALVHAQKIAALGQLTAGIAHEIKNPLNFVNNFAGLSVELLEELKEAAGEAIGTLDAGKRTEVLETIGMLTGNLEKIAEHGRRADGIVRGMLQHSRGSSGDWQATDLNALVEESLNLAYHGARAQDQDFKVTLELDLDRKLAPIEVVSQDVSRVLLNLISNGFYAVTKRGREGDGTYRPTLKIATREYRDGVEIRVRDNGVGIPPEYCEKLFQPFFTTKPTGEGTGLGLSISYEIVIRQHGGTITVDSEVGDFTEFTVRLPRSRHAVARKIG
jgi:signal transduction histidine kinase